MRKPLLVLIGVMLFSSTNAQFKIKRLHIQAQELYDYGSYDKALDKYLELLNNEENAEFNYWVAKCYLQLDNVKSKALSHIIKVPDDVYDNVSYIKGLAYHYSDDFENALAYYRRCNSLQKEILINNCILGKQIDMDSTVQVSLLDNINTVYDDYNLTLFRSNEIFWNRDGPDHERIITSDTSFKQSSLFSKLGEEGHIGILGTSNDKLYVYLPYNNGDIYTTTPNGEEFSLPKKVDIKSSREASSVSFKDSILYFVSDRDGGYGGYDIYCSVFTNGQWSEAVNLGPKVNSPLNEATPFIYGDTLYFSSEKNSIGGYDIVKSIYQNGAWTEPITLTRPINSPYNDMYYKRYNDSLIYLSSNREGNKGGYDIYSVEYLTFEEDSVVEVDSVEVLDTIPPIVFVDTTVVEEKQDRDIVVTEKPLPVEFNDLEEIKEYIEFEITYTMVQVITYKIDSKYYIDLSSFQKMTDLDIYKMIESPRPDNKVSYLIDQKFSDRDGTALKQADILRAKIFNQMPKIYKINPFMAVYGANGERRLILLQDGKYIMLHD